MEREDNFALYYVNHINYRDDSLIIFFTYQEKSTEGGGLEHTLACAVQPQEPINCPVHELTMYIFLSPEFYGVYEMFSWFIPV